jgi:hypothetical protein
VGFVKVTRKVEQIKFQTGMSVRGKLVRIERVALSGSIEKKNQYTVIDPRDGGIVQFLGLNQIDCALFPADVGKWIEVECTGERDDVGRNGNKMKTFDISVWEKEGSEATAKEVDGSVHITDDDIPF